MLFYAVAPYLSLFLLAITADLLGFAVCGLL